MAELAVTCVSRCKRAVARRQICGSKFDRRPNPPPLRILVHTGHIVYKDFLPTNAPDLKVIEKALELKAILISLNGDFADILSYPPKNYLIFSSHRGIRDTNNIGQKEFVRLSTFPSPPATLHLA